MKLTFTVCGQTIEYPQHLCENIPLHEARVLGTIVNDLSLMCEIEDKSNLFHTKDGIIYYELLKNMYQNKVVEFDAGAVQAALNRLGDDFKREFIAINGNGYLNAIKRDFSEKNFESHLQGLIDDVQKLEIYKNLYSNLCDMTNNTTITSDNVINMLENTLENTRDIMEVSGTKPVELTINDTYIQSKVNGIKRGLGYGLYSISKATRGLHLGNVSMLSAFTNVGKTTVNFNEVMLSLLDAGESIFIYSNESTIDDFKDLLLIRTLVKQFKYYQLTRTKLNDLDNIKNNNPELFKEFMMKISQASQYINQHYHGRIILYSVSKYSIAEFNMLMRRYALRGFKYFLIDTMKSEEAGDINAVGKLIQQSRNIYEAARNLNTHVMVSYQIASYLKQNMKRVLDESCLSGSKQVAEILDILICMRELYPDEYTGQRNEVRVFKFIKNPEGKGIVKDYRTLETGKKYLVLFLPKNRYGAKILPTIYEFNGEFGTVSEVGYSDNIQDKAY